MVNKKIVKIIFTTMLLVAWLFLLNTISQAASFSTSISKTTVTVGDTFTVTVKANNAAGIYSVTNSNSNVSLSSGSKSEFLENGSATLTFKAVKAGTVTITAEATDMTDLDDDTKTVKGSKSFTVTVKEKATSTSSSNSSSGSDTTTKPTFSSRNEKVYAKSEVNVRSSYSTSSSVLGTLSAGDSVTRTGIATKSINGILWSKITYNGQTAYISSSYLTTEKPEEKSNNKNLKSLDVTPSGLTPTFSKDTTQYEMTVGSDVDTIKVNAVAEDDKAKVTISGNKNLDVGVNIITIKVTAEDETVRNYKINVTKEEKEQLKLKELLIEGLPLTPEFDGNVYEYTMNLDKNDVTELNVTATPNREDASIEIVGNTELKSGDNVVTILVKSSDESEIVTYQITVKVPESATIATIWNNDLYKYIGIGAAVIVIIIIFIVVVVKRRKNKEEFETFYGGYNISPVEQEKSDNKVEDNLGISNLKEEDRKNKVDEVTSYDYKDDERTPRKRKGKHF